MKKIKIIGFCIIALLLCSCDSFLQQNLLTSYGKNDIYNSEGAVRSALGGCYAKICEYNYRGGLGIYELANSSLILAKSNPELTVIGAITSSNIYLSNPTYNYPYSVISRCNDILYNIKGGTISDALKKEIAGETSLLRAIAYFDIVRSIGRCPLRTIPVIYSSGNTNLPRSPLKDVYGQILNDLRFAESNMVDENHRNSWHPHKWAATALKVKVFMQMASLTDDHFLACKDTAVQSFYDKFVPGNKEAARLALWDSCYTNAKRVYQSGVYKLMPTYAELWNNKSKNTKESIIEFQVNSNFSNAFSLTRVTLSSGSKVDPTKYDMFSPWCPNALLAGQQQRINSSKSTFCEHFLKYGNGKMIVSKTNVTNTITSNSEKGCDPRINTNYLYYNDDRPGYQSYGTIKIFPNNAYSTIFPNIKKYYYDDFKGSASDMNIIYLRFADVILMMAEAANELNRTDEAIGYVNEVLKRARTGNTIPGKDGLIQPADWNSGISQDSCRTAIMFERPFELLCENGDEMFDVRRRGLVFFKKYFDRHNYWVSRLLNPLTDTNASGWGKKLPYDPSEVVYSSITDDFLRKNLYFPLSYYEIQTNTSISSNEQNLGW